MERIIAHWTGGTNKCSQTDKKHYHFIADGTGKIHKGKFDVEDNESTQTPYAAHTYHCNTGSIGIATCGMAGAVQRPLDYGKYPVTKAGWDAMALKAALLCIQYDIRVTRKTVLTHAEVQKTLGIKQRGKWDFTVLPFAPKIRGAAACGNRFRNDVAWFIKMQGKSTSPTIPKRYPQPKTSSKPVPEKTGNAGPIAAVIAAGAATLAYFWDRLVNLF